MIAMDLHVYVPDLGEERSRVSLAALTLGLVYAQPVFFHALENEQSVKERETFALVALFECEFFNSFGNCFLGPLYLAR